VSDLSLSDVLGWIAVVTFVVRLIPQPVRLARTGIPDGVSPLTALNVALTELAWFIYGLSQGSVPIWIVSLPSFPLAMWTVVLLRRQTTRRDLIGAALWTAVIALAWLGGMLGAVLGLAVIVQFGPQVWVALRTDDLQGISPNAWRLSILDACVWGAYGITITDYALIGYASTLIVFAVIILVRVRQTRSTALDVS
jgi:uncharacterized protein with PQ loop repeat